MNAPAVLLAVLTLVARPAPLVPGPLVWHGFSTLTDAQARQLAGRPALFQVYVEGEPDGDPEHGWRYDCQGEGEPLRTVWLQEGDDVTAASAQRSNGLLLVEAVLGRIVHPRVKGADGSSLPALVEYRLVRTRVAGTDILPREGISRREWSPPR
jgi:hypothetical protein